MSSRLHHTTNHRLISDSRVPKCYKREEWASREMRIRFFFREALGSRSLRFIRWQQPTNKYGHSLLGLLCNDSSLTITTSKQDNSICRWNGIFFFFFCSSTHKLNERKKRRTQQKKNIKKKKTKFAYLYKVAFGVRF